MCDHFGRGEVGAGCQAACDCGFAARAQLQPLVVLILERGDLQGKGEASLDEIEQRIVHRVNGLARRFQPHRDAGGAAFRQ